ncbi:MAG: hypothetical protein K2H05_04260 [Duncaniella sp.]|nr:hypothetical protein [Duncaniella sp.]
MKKIALLTIAIVVAIICSCSRDEPTVPQVFPNKGNSNSDKDNYYVRYELTMGSALSADCSVNSDNGMRYIHVKNKGSLNETFGPVKKGFYTRMDTKFHNEGHGGTTTYSIKIYVSINQEPFTLKASEEGNLHKNMTKSCNISYKIGN